jgi:SAM-dependent methyltransferase
MKDLDQDYWDQRHQKGETGWDLKMVSPPLKNYFDQPFQPMGKVLIPGCGQAHEARYLVEQGQQDLAIMDFAPSLMESLKVVFDGSQVALHCEDIFEHQGKYDTIVEQTLMCAIDPSLRMRFVNKIADLLHRNGVWVGLLFNREFEHAGPPFGGSEKEYRELLESRFEIILMEVCTTSVLPRAGTELFFIAKKTH